MVTCLKSYLSFDKQILFCCIKS